MADYDTSKLLTLINGNLMVLGKKLDQLSLIIKRGTNIDVHIPEIKVPEATVKVEMPEVSIPEIKIPEANVKVEMSDVKLPDINVPEIKIPKIEIPEIKIPEIKVPDIIIPEIKVPPVKMPDEMKVKDLQKTADKIVKAIENNSNLLVEIEGERINKEDFYTVLRKALMETSSTIGLYEMLLDISNKISQLGIDLEEITVHIGSQVGLENIAKERINPATEETSQSIAAFNIPPYDTQIVDETDPDNMVITYKKDGEVVATKTINIDDATTTVAVI